MAPKFYRDLSALEEGKGSVDNLKQNTFTVTIYHVMSISSVKAARDHALFLASW